MAGECFLAKTEYKVILQFVVEITFYSIIIKSNY